MRAYIIAVALLASIVLLISGCANQPSGNPTGSSDCTKITDKAAKDNCFYDEAVNSTKISGCENIASSTLKDGCIAQIAINTSEVGLCIKPQSAKSIGYCYAQISINQKNMSLCQETPEKGWRHACTKQIAIATNQSQYCRQLTAQNPDDRDECFGMIALKKQDRALCQEVLKALPRRNCLLYVGVATKNLSVCTELGKEDRATEGYCYTKIAENTLNSSVCSFVPLDMMQADCYAKFNITMKINETQMPVAGNRSGLTLSTSTRRNSSGMAA